MSHKELLIEALEKSNGGLNRNQIERATGLNIVEFLNMKSQINKNNKKYANIQIVTKGSHGKSVWLLANKEPITTMNYGDRRAKKVITSIGNMKQSDLIALASEQHESIRQRMAVEMAQRVKRLIQIASI